MIQKATTRPVLQRVVRSLVGGKGARNSAPVSSLYFLLLPPLCVCFSCGFGPTSFFAVVAGNTLWRTPDNPLQFYIKFNLS